MRMIARDRNTMILNCAVKLVNEKGFNACSYEAVAKSCPIKTTSRLVRHYYPKLRSLWEAVAQHDNCEAQAKDEALAMGLTS